MAATFSGATEAARRRRPDRTTSPGAVTAASPLEGTGEARLGGATVSFTPGARTNWHTHPLGQLLIVTQSRGWVQAEGGPAREIGPATRCGSLLA